jgi:hypothetical protein
LNDLGWDETIDSERVTLTVPPGSWCARLRGCNREAARALGTYVSRPEDEEAIAERNFTASAAFAELLSQLATPPCSADDADAGGEGSR